MSCCGRYRETARAPGNGLPAAGQVASSSLADPLHATVRPVWSSAIRESTALGMHQPGVALQYREHARIQVRGPITGRAYIFDAMQSAVVDMRDAEVLLRSQRFQRVAAGRSR